MSSDFLLYSLADSRFNNYLPVADPGGHIGSLISKKVKFHVSHDLYDMQFSEI